MANRTTSNEAYDVPDSTDWLGTSLSTLMPVEQALRCHVCKDFYTSPMLTSCNHTFCSLCIRRCLSVDGKCPLCRANDQESKLRGNWALREAVDAFTKSRAAILEFARTPQQPLEIIPASPKRTASQMEDIEDGSNSNQSKRPRMSTRSSRSKGAEATAAIMREEASAPESKDPMDYEPADGLAACPICWARMKPWQVDKHIDTSCPGSPQPAASASRAPSQMLGSFAPPPPAPSNRAMGPPAAAKPLERLPALNYSILKDQALRKRMAELSLTTSGPRQLLERRHKEWVTIWNANCDSARPKNRMELLHDLDVWERTLGGRAPVTLSTQRGAQIRDKDFDGTAWAAKHDTSFKDLIANARRSRNQAKNPPREGTDSDRAPGEEPGIAPGPHEEGDGMHMARTEPTIDLTGSPSRPAQAPDVGAVNGVVEMPYALALNNTSNTTQAAPERSQPLAMEEPQPLRPDPELLASSTRYFGEGLP